MQGLPVTLKLHNLQLLDKALDLFIEFKYFESDFYFLNGSKIVWWLLITSIQCISLLLHKLRFIYLHVN